MTRPRAWSALLKERDSLLLDLLAEKVEDLCGYKPELALCGQFLERVPTPHITTPVPLPRSLVRPSVREPKRPQGVHARSVVSFTFRGETYESRSARDVFRRVFQLLAKEDPGFCDNFAARKHGTRRRYLAQDRRELFPDDPDRVEKDATEIAHGWWLGTHYSRRSMQNIVNLALEVVHPSLRSVIQINIDGTVSTSAQFISPPGKEPKKPRGVHTRAVNSFVFRGQTYECRSAREVLSEVFRLLAREEPDFPERFAARKHGRYLSQNRQDLYPSQPSGFTENNSAEIAPGWWLATNQGRSRIQHILDLALEVVHPSLRSEIQVNLDG